MTLAHTTTTKVLQACAFDQSRCGMQEYVQPVYRSTKETSSTMAEYNSRVHSGRVHSGRVQRQQSTTAAEYTAAEYNGSRVQQQQSTAVISITILYTLSCWTAEGSNNIRAGAISR